MNRKIETIDGLRAEIKRLEIRSEELKTALKEDADGIKEYFKPLNLFFNAVSGFARMKFAPPLFSGNGLGEGVRSILEPFIEKAFARISAAIEEFFKKRKKVVHEDE